MPILRKKISAPILKSIETARDATGLSETDFYHSLTTRNRHFVSTHAQENLKNLKIFVGGCGSAGGACIEPLIRLGATKMRIADNGAYDLANLNRQHAFVDSIGVNKAAFHASEVKRINPYAEIHAYQEGITPQNIPEIAEWADVIIDAVDVTTPDAVVLKIMLHEEAKKRKKPVFSMLDMGFCQWGVGYDYRQPSVQVFNGNLEKAKKSRHPLKATFSMFPLSVVPAHSMPLVIDILTDAKVSASQLGCASDMLSSVIAPSILRFAEYGEVVKGWNINLERLASPWWVRLIGYLQYPKLWWQARKLIAQLE